MTGTKISLSCLIGIGKMKTVGEGTNAVILELTVIQCGVQMAFWMARQM